MLNNLKKKKTPLITKVLSQATAYTACKFSRKVKRHIKLLQPLCTSIHKTMGKSNLQRYFTLLTQSSLPT